MVHHFLYIVILAYLLHHNMTPLFAVALVEELPIVLLSIFEVQDKRRPSLLFGVLYYVTRVVFHTVLIYKAYPMSTFVFVGELGSSSGTSRCSGSAATSSSRPPAMSFRAKLTLMFTMLISQIGTHAFVAYEVVENLPRDANYAPMAVLHGLVFVYFLYHFTVVHDVYSQNFIMTSIGRKKIIYNISWEDPAIDHTVMHMKEDDVVLTISSAGCNVLDYLCEGPKKIIAVDMNWAQLHVLELKLHVASPGTFFVISPYFGVHRSLQVQAPTPPRQGDGRVLGSDTHTSSATTSCTRAPPA